MPWVKCARHYPKCKFRRIESCSKAVRQRDLKRKVGEVKPTPKIAGPLHAIGTFSKNRRAKFSVESPAMPASKRIKLAPGSKLALKFPHLVQDVSTTKGTGIGVGTPGASNEGCGSSGLLNNIL